MTWTIRPARFNLRLVRALCKALAKDETCCGLVSQSYRLLVPVPGMERPEPYTICLVRDDEGTCMVVCHEVPEVLVFEGSEGEALAAAQAAIEEALVGRESVAHLLRPAQPWARSGPSALRQRLA